MVTCTNLGITLQHELFEVVGVSVAHMYIYLSYIHTVQTADMYFITNNIWDNVSNEPSCFGMEL